MSEHTGTQEYSAWADEAYPWPQEPVRVKERVQSDHDHMVIGGVRLNLSDVLNADYLTPRKTKELAAAFQAAKPFPHLVLEGLFSPKLLELVCADFEKVGWSSWVRYDNEHELKRGSLPNTRFGTAAQLYFNTIYSGVFLDFLSRVTGIDGLITDPEFHGGGLHEIPQGGKFSMHVDFNKHPVTRLANRLVLITYLNKDWLASYGAALELWDLDTKQRQVSIEPTFGRTVLFLQSRKSLHGHPDPVNTPDGRTRRSATAYFYSNQRAAEDATHAHATLFPVAEPRPRHERFFNAVRYLLPPVLIDAGRRIRTTLKG
jgi:Rps23 Pro-64 3,4-dihydroxylase Tpa1-like proline 4-hydroxylase